MRLRRLGKSDLSVSEISLGSWLTFGAGVERSRGIACVRKALELGINFFDTANIYGRGAAESFLGEALSGVPRESYLLATKLYFPMTATDRGLSAKQVQKQLDDSLLRLRVDHVDLYQCHRYDEATPLEETMQALARAVEQGKTRYVGFSEWTPSEISEALQIPAVRFVSSQPQYSMLWRTPEHGVFPLCHENGIGQIVWSPLAQGVLTGKYKPGAPPPPESRAQSESMGGFIDRFLQREVLAAVAALQVVADDVGCTMSQLAIAWVLRRPEVTSAIIGATRPEQVEENAKASGIVLSEDVLRRIDVALGGVAEV